MTTLIILLILNLFCVVYGIIDGFKENIFQIIFNFCVATYLFDTIQIKTKDKNNVSDK
jgi:hypothetical protein